MALCRQWVEALPSPQGLLKNVQKDGRELLLKTGLPTKDLEPWRLTDLKRLENLLKLPLPTNNKDLSVVNSHQWANEPNEGLRIVVDPYNESIKIPNGLLQMG